MRKQYLSAPLPFVGQKRMFAREFIQVLKRYPDDAVFVDLFGGSGLLSHITKYQKPGATVVYNDFDNYRQRLENIPRTNVLLDKIRAVVASVPRRKFLPKKTKETILRLIEQEEHRYGYVDYITLSSSLLFSMKYATNLEELRKETFYNTVRKCDYNPCLDYLDGLEIVSCDYKELFNKYKDMPDVVFLIDPPSPQMILIIRCLYCLHPKMHPEIKNDSLIIILYIKSYLPFLNKLTIVMICDILF